MRRSSSCPLALHGKPARGGVCLAVGPSPKWLVLAECPGKPGPAALSSHPCPALTQPPPRSSAWSSTTPAAGARRSRRVRRTARARWWRASTSLIASLHPAPTSATNGSRPSGKGRLGLLSLPEAPASLWALSPCPQKGLNPESPSCLWHANPCHPGSVARPQDTGERGPNFMGWRNDPMRCCM